MKILIVNTSDISGGAARAAYRLHCALRSNSVDSIMLVQNKLSDDYTVVGPVTRIQKIRSKLAPLLNSIRVRLYKNRSKTLFSPSLSGISNLVERINVINPDIVHMHWVCGGMMCINDISKIKAPIVWSLHDMWAFTGGCHYDEECGRYKESCGICPVLGSQTNRDLSAKVWSRKQKFYSSIKNITVVGLSSWLANAASESSLFSNKTVINLPNPINTNIFAPFDKSYSRKLLNLPDGKKIILFGAMNATGDPRKGFRELYSALETLNGNEYELVIFGSSEPEHPQGFRQKTYYLGQINDDVTLRILYNSADVMVVPSLQENLSNAIMESLACGTPVVGFNIGGNGDMIDHKKNGYLAVPFDIIDLANGIEWVLKNNQSFTLSSDARNKILKHFDSNMVADCYIKLYRKILNRNDR